MTSNLETLLPFLSPIDGQQDEMLALVEDLCNMNSGTFNVAGIADVKERLEKEYAALGGEIKTLDSALMEKVDDKGSVVSAPLGPMLHVSKWPEAKFKVLLCIHMDTVYPIDHDFQKCVRLENGSINGPGVADAKGGIVVMLQALKTLEASPLAGKIGWEVLLNADEEIGSPGSIHAIKDIASRCNVGLLFEPSLPDGTLVSWRKGSGNFSFVVRGKAAHAGREFEKGRNAIVACSRLIDDIAKLNTDTEVTFNVGRISGGGPLNVVPDLAIGRVNARVKTPEQLRDVESKFAGLVEKYNQLDGISVEMHGSFTSPPKPLCEQSVELQKRIESCGAALDINVGWRGTGGASDGNKFAAAGLPNIDTLGPRGGNIHSSDEYLLPESLEPCAKMTALILLSYAESVD
jgi:glutamate carboxypeptidase